MLLNPDKTDYDVIIVGGGPAGSAAALTIARYGYEVLLLEASKTKSFKIGEGLPPAARPILTSLGLWERFKAQNYLPSYGNLSAWGSSQLNQTDFIYDLNGTGWHLNRSHFDSFLREEACMVGAKVIEGVVLKDFTYNSGLWSIYLSEVGIRQLKPPLSCRWLVDASGQRGAVSQPLGIQKHFIDKLVGVYALFPAAYSDSGSHDQDSRTLIEAAPDGWWYSVLVPQGYRIVTFMTDLAYLASQRSLLTTVGFVKAVQATDYIKSYLAQGNYSLPKSPQTSPAFSTYLAESAGAGWIATGDAALSFDPLSSQGIMTALYTGLKAGECLHSVLQSRLQSGSSTPALQEYNHRLKKIYSQYLDSRFEYYAVEKRWRHHQFWQNRQHKIFLPQL